MLLTIQLRRRRRSVIGVWNGHYDEWVCTTYPVYNPNTVYRGNVTSVTAYANAAAQTGASTDSLTYDLLGNLVEQTANCCRKKTFGYSDVYDFGYVTSETRGETGQLSSSATYDFNTGLVRTTVNENNRTTTIHYDPASLRTLQILRPEGTSTFASTSFYYYDRLLSARKLFTDTLLALRLLTRIPTAIVHNGRLSRYYSTTLGSGGIPKSISFCE